MSYALHPAQIAVLNAQAKLPLVAVLAVRFAVVVVKWDTRRRTRLALKTLEPHLLRDVGLEPHTAMTEANKPFWRY